MKYKIKHIILVLVVVSGHLMLDAQAQKQSDTINLKRQERVNVLFGKQTYDRFVGNMDAVKGEDLKSYPSMMVLEALRGRMPGYFLLQDNGNVGEDNFNQGGTQGYVRGSVGSVITLVDGVERPLNPYDVDQIQEIRLLKDPVSKALYGGRISQGILMVTTKRGKPGKSEFHIGVQRGVKTPTSIPRYLNSFDFATNYNRALANDGISTGAYTQAQLDGYKNQTNPYMYPSVDYYGQFLNKSMSLTRVNTEYYGGNETTQFYLHGGFQQEGGLEVYDFKQRQMQTFNLQTNLDSKFSDAITLHANIATYKGNKQYPGALGGTILGTLSSRYPNAYPILVARDSAGGTSSYKDNPFAQQNQSGYTLENHLRMQADLSFDVKLDKLLKGLSFTPAYSFDIFHKQNLQKLNTVAIYSISAFDSNGRASAYTTIQTPVKATGQTLGSDNYSRRWAFTGTLAYQSVFGKSALNVDVDYFITKTINAGDALDYKRENVGLRANYTFDGKYTVEGVVNYCGSQSYSPDKRFRTYPAIGAGWLISSENFMRENSAFNFLKLNASWGVMGDGNIAANLWRQAFGATATYAFNSAASAATTQLNVVGSSILDWPKQREVDINMEATMFRRMNWKVSYFDYLQSDWLSQRTNIVPLILGGSTFLPQANYGKTALKGIELELGYSGNSGKVNYTIGSHLTYGKSKKVQIDELPDPNYHQQGTPWDAVWGYQANGTYSQAEIDQIKAGTSTLPRVSFMDPKALLAGNIKYKDLNGDGIVDKYDTRAIGNNAPRLMYGSDLKVGYKGVDLYVMFVGYGAYRRQLNNNYYQVYSTRKYSNVVLNGLPNGNPQPLLTTGAGTNDFGQTSDYWIVNGGFLKLQNVSISYTLPKKTIDHMKMTDMKLFLYCTNLATFSKIKDSDPESINAGLSDYPLFRTFAIGITASF